MIRRNRSAVINIGVFFFCLFVIFCINSSQTQSVRHYAWNKVQYQGTSHTPPMRGICPGVSESLTKPVLIIARTLSEPISAFDAISDRYHLCPYIADALPNTSSTHLQTPANRGHEAMAYLTFIIDNYANLPPTGMVFVHGSRFAWHNDDPFYDNVSLLKQLNMTRALWGPPGPATGYWNMKCDWSAGTCDANSDEGKPQGSIETRARAMLEPKNKRAVSDVALVAALNSIFGQPVPTSSTTRHRRIDGRFQTMLSRQDTIRSQCCAQFVVARENIWSHTWDEYVALRQWLLDGTYSTVTSQHAINVQHPHLHATQPARLYSSPPAPADDLIAGRILSYIWHILFLANFSQTSQAQESDGVDLVRLNALACPSAELCYCRLYGRCNLPGCDRPGRCRGQYRVPVGYRLPKGWAEQYS